MKTLHNEELSKLELGDHFQVLRFEFDANHMLRIEVDGAYLCNSQILRLGPGSITIASWSEYSARWYHGQGQPWHNFDLEHPLVIGDIRVLKCEASGLVRLSGFGEVDTGQWIEYAFRDAAVSARFEDQHIRKIN